MKTIIKLSEQEIAEAITQYLRKDSLETISVSLQQGGDEDPGHYANRPAFIYAEVEAKPLK